MTSFSRLGGRSSSFAAAKRAIFIRAEESREKSVLDSAVSKGGGGCSCSRGSSNASGGRLTPMWAADSRKEREKMVVENCFVHYSIAF